MKRASVSEAKNKLSALIDGLRSGDAVLILDRGIPVARLEPVSPAGLHADDDLLAPLVREGIVRPGKLTLDKAWVRQVPDGEGARLLDALLEERRQGR